MAYIVMVDMVMVDTVTAYIVMAPYSYGPWRTEDRRDAAERFERPQRSRSRLYNYGPI